MRILSLSIESIGPLRISYKGLGCWYLHFKTRCIAVLSLSWVLHISSVFPYICSLVPFQMSCYLRIITQYPKGFCPKKQWYMIQRALSFLLPSWISHDWSSEILFSSVNWSHLICSSREKKIHCWFSSYKIWEVAQKEFQRRDIISRG